MFVVCGTISPSNRKLIALSIVSFYVRARLRFVLLYIQIMALLKRVYPTFIQNTHGTTTSVMFSSLV